MDPLAFIVVVGALVAAFYSQPEPAPYVPDRAVLLPSADGTVGRVIITSATGTQEIAKAYEAVAVGEQGNIALYQESEEAIKSRHGQLLASRPKPVSKYLLYFKPGSNELTAESLLTLEELKRDARERAAVEIRVIGHTDTVGNASANESLSLKRAEGLVQQLTSAGVQAASYEAVGRGELDLLVPTADGVSEPRNRRVEISIR